MDSNNIDAFLAIVDEQSVSRAAERMYLSQSTVSHRLKRLEAYVNCELIDRAQGQRDSILTAQGEAFFAACKALGTAFQRNCGIQISPAYIQRFRRLQ